MTREEAIRQLDGADIAVLNRDFFKFNQAIIMAISAIRQQEHFREVTKKVEPMTLDDAIAHLDDTLSDMSRKWSCESCRMEHVQLRAWLAELRDIKQKRNTPLTLDELRQMNEEPVWIKLFDPDEAFWVLRNEWVDTRNPEPMILFHMRWYSHVDYGKTWLAYRQKPEEETV